MTDPKLPNPAQPRHRFNNHLDNDFVEFVRGRVHRRCSALDLAAYKDANAEERLEDEARAAIVSCFQEAWTDSWFPVTMRRDWPVADAVIYDDDPDEPAFALIKFSYSPETNFFQGGSPIKAVKVYVTRPPKNIWQRTLKAFKGKPVAEDMAPVGTPDGKLRAPVQKTKAIPARKPLQKPSGKV